MKFANVRDLKINSKTIIRKLIKEDVVITNRGKPVAAVIYLNEDLLDSFVIAHHPTLLSGIELDAPFNLLARAVPALDASIGELDNGAARVVELDHLAAGCHLQ